MSRTPDASKAADRLVRCVAGDRVLVSAVEAEPSRVDRLAALGILPGCELRVQQTRPVFVIESDETVLALEREIAATIAVVRLPSDRGAR